MAIGDCSNYVLNCSLSDTQLGVVGKASVCRLCPCKAAVQTLDFTHVHLELFVTGSGHMNAM